MWIDAHCHLADSRIESQLEEAINHSKILGISAWVQGGISPEDWSKQEALKTRFPSGILTSFGMHPWWIAERDEATLDKAFQILSSKLPFSDGFGELGLDFSKRFLRSPIQEKQKNYFEKQLGLLKTIQKPLVLHVVDAHAVTIEVLKKHTFPGGIVHSFSAGPSEAKAYMDLGLTISISGVITRDGYKRLKEAVKALPKDKIVIETDCPDQKPVGGKGDLNLPENLLLVADAVASLRNETRDEVLNYSTENIKRVFKR